MSISDKEFYNLTISINKALNPMEAPLKIKHARSVIITTHRTKEGKSFWAVVTRQPIMEYRFTAWKFCHLLHKVLREGHETCIRHSQSHKKMILEMGKLWGHLQDGVGHCIQAYSKLIVTKLDFHEKNVIFPGSLLIEFRDIEKFAGDDINVYFQLCVEIFDYLDDIIDVQSKVFASINTYRMSSMTPQGQCRLAPLITLIQDSNPLYDLSVRVMFKLHDELPSDILVGHRDRFRDMFSKLKFFYDNVRPLQYFADLIQVPHLPEAAPNFTSKVDFGRYIPPVVVVPPEPEPHPVMDNLVDMNNSQEQSTLESEYSEKVLTLVSESKQKDDVIGHLKIELSELRNIMSSMHSSHQQEIHKLKEELLVINTELNDSKEFGTNMRVLKDELELQLKATPTLLQKVSKEEERAKVSEEKFNKLKNMYSQIRDEHIQLLRQHGETSKQFSKIKNDNSSLLLQIDTMQTQLNESQESFKAKEELLNNTILDYEKKVKQISGECETMQMKFQRWQEQHDDVQKIKQDNIQQLTFENAQLLANVEELNECKSKLHGLERHLAETEEKNSIERIEMQNLVNKLEKELKEISGEREAVEMKFQESQEQHDNVQKIKLEKIQHLTFENAQLLSNVEELNECKSKLHGLERHLAETEEKNSMERIENQKLVSKLEKELYIKTEEALKMEELQKIEMESVKNELKKRADDFKILENITKDKDVDVIKITAEKKLLENELHDLLQQNSGYELKLNDSRNEIEKLSLKMNENTIQYKSLIFSLIQAVLKTVETVSFQKINKNLRESFDAIFLINEDLKISLNELYLTYKMYNEGQDVAENLCRKTILVGFYFAMLKQNCISVYNSTSNIEKGEEILSKIDLLCDPLKSLLESLTQSKQVEDVDTQILSIKTLLDALNKLVHDLLQTTNASLDLGDLVENELSEMDKAIEEAAERIVEMLSSARSVDSGIKLEVNEKILDACTNLMKCIKILIQKSKVLQEEIVAFGRGNASAKEFYKRNSQWSEGLISASKSVAKGANLLVEAANKAVSGESNKSFEIIVAAQEIAACTAQLVVASKVKAPRESQKLVDLTKASRNVSQATGAVVATVKDCNHQLDLSQEVDLTKLTSNQAKTMEMDIHVKVLELEQALQVERMRLSAFRRQNYQNTED